jgi:hypothetical protein
MPLNGRGLTWAVGRMSSFSIQAKMASMNGIREMPDFYFLPNKKMSIARESYLEV